MPDGNIGNSLYGYVKIHSQKTASVGGDTIWCVRYYIFVGTYDAD